MLKHCCAVWLAAALSAGCGEETPKHSDADLAGAWIAAGEFTFYFETDGAGAITDYAGFELATSAGTYAVSGEGQLTLTFHPSTPDEVVLTGSLTSSTTGSVSGTQVGGFTLAKVEDPGTCSGHWFGALTLSTGGSSAFYVGADAAGAIVLGSVNNGMGVTSMTGRKLYCAGGVLSGFAQTPGASPWDELRFTGARSGDAIEGTFETGDRDVHGTFEADWNPLEG